MSRLEVPTDSLNVHLSLWLYHLRMCQAHLEEYRDTLHWATGLEFTYNVISDLLEACEDAATFVRTSELPAGLRPEEEAGLGPRGGGVQQ